MGPTCLHGGLLERLGLLEAIWNALGCLLEWSWKVLQVLEKVLLNCYWPLQVEFQERFWLSSGPKGSPKVAKRALNQAQEAVETQNGETLIFLDRT